MVLKKYDCTFIGDINPDMVMLSGAGLPELGMEKFADNFYMALGGSTAICAAVLGSFGTRANFYGCVGDDILGDYCVNTLSHCGVDATHVHRMHRSATPVTISIATPDDRALISYSGNGRIGIQADDISPALIDETRHIHVGSFFIQHKQMQLYRDLFREAQRQGVSTSLDAGYSPTGDWDHGIFELLPYVDFFFPNEIEALSITGQQHVRDAAKQLGSYCHAAVIKRGAEGSVLYSGGEYIQSKAFTGYKEIDSTGAGDAFNAGFLHAYLHGMDYGRCLKYGNASGALRVSIDRSAQQFASVEQFEEAAGKDEKQEG